MAPNNMTNFLVLTLLLISSYNYRIVSCDAISGQVEFQQQELLQQQQQQLVDPQSELQQQGQLGVVDASAQVGYNGVAPIGEVGLGLGAGVAAGVGVAAAAGGDELVKWQQSGLYIEPFDIAILAIPQMQRDFVNKLVEDDLELFREILREAIDRRNKFAPSVGLIWKYAAKLIGRFISNRREEMKLPERIEPKPEFFGMLADMADTVLAQSALIKKEKGYSKSNIDVDDLYRRVDNVFKYVQTTIEVAPVAAYLKWNQLILFKNDATNPEHDRPIIDEASDLTAQLRSMGYESCVFVARRVVNLLRMFSKGSIPQSDQDV